MKITIELTEAEVKGLKDYIRESEDIKIPKKKDIQREIRGIVSGYLQSQHSALTDYIQKYVQS